MTCQRCADLERALAGVRELADEMECTYGDNCPDFGSRHGRCIGCKLRSALAAADKMGPEAAGNCSKCGGPVYHRPGKPGEYDHECAADDKMGPGAESSIPRCDGGGVQPSAPAAPCEDYSPPLVADGTVPVTLRPAGPLPPPTWDAYAAAPCGTCGGSGLYTTGHGEFKQVYQMTCPDCAQPATVGEEEARDIAGSIYVAMSWVYDPNVDDIIGAIKQGVLAGAAAERRRP